MELFLKAMDLLATAAPTSAISAVLVWVVMLLLGFRRDKRETTTMDAQISHDGQKLMVELLQSARAALAEANERAEKLDEKLAAMRIHETNSLYYSQALSHIEAILQAHTVEERQLAEEHARLFLERMGARHD